MLDEVKIFAKAGNGGNGSASFFRAKHVTDGGPDGGNGGNGGNVIVRAVKNLNSLVELSYQKKYIAEDGKKGLNKLQHGRNGKDKIIEVPIGTQIYNEEGDLLICDLNEEGQDFTIAHGGKGGRGNNTMKTSTNQAPKNFTPGQEGEAAIFYLQLKIISNVGLLGFPNAGKSSFLNAVSNAKQKTADYPFTTLEPKLGFVQTTYYDGFTIVDVPGLIEGASKGMGLGKRFLKHLERVRIMLHIVDGSEDNVAEQYKLIREEINNSNQSLRDKTEIVVLNKIDLLEAEEIKEKIQELQNCTDNNIHAVSTINKSGIQKLIQNIAKEIGCHF